MCGILGLAAKQLPDERILIAMRDAMSHRGPDDAGLWISSDKKVCLSQRRLAIIDLSPDGHQPMSDATGKVHITFNGEIYNYLELRQELQAKGHIFKTASDTEVILEAYLEWGEESVTHLNGMFAFALYDPQKQQLLISRDRAGEKPLYYWLTPDGLWFASELKAFTANPNFPRRIEPHALDSYLTFGYIPGDECIFRGVKKLPAAHMLIYKLDFNEINIHRYWSLPEPPVSVASTNELLNQFESLLEDSVRRQLIADVPVGILLSGGIDSSLVTAMAARVSAEPVKTFTISFPGHRVEDEVGYARLVAQYFGAVHTELAVEPASLDLLPQLARQFDEPMADSSMVPSYLVSRLIREHATVALGGDGGDELFAGYPTYREILKDARFFHIPSNARKMIGWCATRLMPVGMKGRHHLMGLAGDVADNAIYYNVMFDPHTRARLVPALSESSTRILKDKRKYLNPAYTSLQQVTRMDFQTRMVDDYLVKVDRASMLASLETRAPFLDYRIVEFAFGCIPDSLRANTQEVKILPRMLAKKVLPAQLDINRKQGFSIPLKAWLKNEWFDYSQAVLSEADENIFNRREVNNLFESLNRRGFSNKWRIFTILLFELWRREYQAVL
ncbi:MAG: asparagine synthase (glutamine-hydrolyzing) [Chloroflexi bacterium]|nr:asparagine synthase (glutamine-hydrolyzing) [Chloroflexota bacterium]